MILGAHGQLRSRAGSPSRACRPARGGSRTSGGELARGARPWPRSSPRRRSARRSLLARRRWPGAEHRGAAATSDGAGSPPTRDASPRLTLRAVDAMRLPKNGAAALVTDACEHYRAAHAAWRQAVVDQRAAVAWTVIGALVESFARHYAQAKRAAARLDFDDLELGVRDLLRDRDDLRRRWAARYDAVMVDEFQDVNPLQAEVLALLDRDDLFAVGDRLQSIYGFRHADVAIFDRAAADLQARGRYATLRTNFRGKRELLDAIDLAFDDAFAGVGFIELEAGRPDADEDAPRPPVELLVCDATGWDERATELGIDAPGAPPWRQAEARAMAARVRAELDAGRDAGDVVVLLRATGDMALYERALAERGVPTYLVGGRGFWGQREVQDLVAWLALLANPDDEPRLWEALASPLVGASSDALVLLKAAARHAKTGPWAALLAGVAEDGATLSSADAALHGLSADDRARLVAFAALVRSERADAPRRSLEALLDRALTLTGYDMALLRAPGGERKLANVRKLLRLARAHEAIEGPDPRAFLDRVAALARGEAAGEREGEAPVEGETLQAVRLMTVHRAKGLEFDVVCVADLGRRRPNGRGRELDVGADGRAGLKLVTLDGGESAPAFAWNALADERSDADAAEERRLFYVAATRARERLILSGAADLDDWPDATKGPPIAWLAPAFAGSVSALIDEPPAGDAGVAGGPPAAVENVILREREGRTVRIRCERVTPDTLPLAPDAERAADADAAAPDLPPLTPPVVEASPALGTRLSYSALEAYARCGYRYHLQRDLGLPDEPPPPGVPAAPGLAPTVRGSIVHALLEETDFADPQPPADDAVAALAGAMGAKVAPGEAFELTQLLAGLAGTPIAARLAAATDVRREDGFAFLVQEGPAAGLLLTGALDVLATEPDGAALVVDWKSDRTNGEDLAKLVEAGYGTQRIVYALAALRNGAERVHVVHCFLERPGAAVEAVYERSDVERLEAEVASLAEGILASDFTPTDEPHRDLCATCPGRPALCSHDESMTLRARPDPPSREVRVSRSQPVQERLF